MKTAREIIADHYPSDTKRDCSIGADFILAALAAEGFSIVETVSGRIDLPARERRALDRLMERPGSVVTSEALIAAIWPNADGGPENAADVLSHVICRLRAGLGKGLRITTHRNLGYSIDAPARSTREGKT